MAFLVEDGTGLANSNAYDSVANFKTHHTDRGTFAVGDFSDAQIEQGLINASDYIDKRFGRHFRGMRQRDTQAMEWPRVSAVDDDGFLIQDVPTQLKKGTNEYAWVWLKLERNLAPIPVPGFPILNAETQAVIESTGVVTAKSEKVGPIEESTEYATSASSSNKPVTSSGSDLTQQIPEYPQADLWIEELLEYGHGELARG